MEGGLIPHCWVPNSKPEPTSLHSRGERHAGRTVLTHQALAPQPALPPAPALPPTTPATGLMEFALAHVPFPTVYFSHVYKSLHRIPRLQGAWARTYILEVLWGEGRFIVAEDASDCQSTEGGKATSAVCATINADGEPAGSCVFSK